MALTYLMQGLNAAQTIITWRAFTPDWTGASAPEAVTDVTIYTASRPSAATVPIVCTVLEPTDLRAMVGAKALITGRISRPGTVSLSGLGAATVAADLSWSYLLTPASAGSLPTTVTATDASNGTTSAVSITLTVAAAATLPGGITPLAFIRPDMAAFQDTSGSTPAAVGQTMRRLNEVAPLSGIWQTTVDPTARVDAPGFALEPASTAVGLPLAMNSGPGAAIDLNSSVLAISWVQRHQGPFNLMQVGGAFWGVAVVAGLYVYINGVLTSLGLTTTVGARHSLVVRMTPTGVRAKLLTNGAVTGDVTVAATITAGHPGFGNLEVGHGDCAAYGTYLAAFVSNGTLSDATADQVLAYLESIPARPAFPIDQPLLACTGDSNTVGVNSAQFSVYKFAALRDLRATYNPEMICTAIVGTGVNGHAGLIAPYFDVRRRKHVASFFAGTNDIATMAGPTTVAAIAAAAFVQIDAMRAQGWDVIVFTVQDRNGLFGGSNTHATYRTNIDALNALYRAGAATRGLQVVDVAAIPQVGADGAADNTTYFSSDKVHFTDAAHALIAPFYTAAVQALLA